MTTFLDLVKANGFQSINEYLDACDSVIQNLPDLSETQMRRIRRNEAATEANLGA